MSSEEGKLFVGGLNFNTDERALEDHFSSFGPRSELERERERERERLKGFSFALFTCSEEATTVVQASNGGGSSGHGEESRGAWQATVGPA
uniref:RRM domain-containing protein n=1 Tax=Capra hircus TaxID=9925 RepID=A0A8C2SAL5_CAPHI